MGKKKLSLSYRIWMESDAWKRTRQRIINERGATCEECKKYVGQSIHAHHKTYEYFGGREAMHPECIQLLCGQCHYWKHNTWEDLDSLIETELAPYGFKGFHQNKIEGKKNE